MAGPSAFSRSVHLTGTVDTAGSTITRTADDGSSVVYTYNSTLGAYVSSGQSGALDTLTWNAGSSTWTWNDAADQQQETYTSTGVLSTLTDTATGASYRFSYSSGQLSTITASDGDTLTFGYSGSQLKSLSITETPPGGAAPVTRQVVGYTYDTQGRLSTVSTTLASDTDTGATGSYTTTYTYNGSTDEVASVQQGDGSIVSYTYNASNQVATIKTGSGSDASTLTHHLRIEQHHDHRCPGQRHHLCHQCRRSADHGDRTDGEWHHPTTHYSYDANGNLLTMTDGLATSPATATTATATS